MISPPAFELRGLHPIVLYISSFPEAASALVSPHDGRVDHEILIIRIVCKNLEDLFPNTSFGPASKSLVSAFPIAESFGHVASVRSAAQHPQHRSRKSGYLRLLCPGPRLCRVVDPRFAAPCASDNSHPLGTYNPRRLVAYASVKRILT